MLCAFHCLGVRLFKTCCLSNTVVDCLVFSLSNLVVSYYDYAAGNLKVLRCGDPTCTPGNVASIESVDSDVDVGGYSSLQLDSSSFPVVSYFDFWNGTLKVLRCSDTACANTPSITTPDDSGAALTNEVGLFSSLELDPMEYPSISYYDYSNDALKFVKCGSSNC